IVIGIVCLKSGPLSPVGERARVRGSMDHGLSLSVNASEDSGEGSLTKHNAGKRSPPHPNPLPRGGGEGTGQNLAASKRTNADESRTPVWTWFSLAVCLAMIWAMLLGALSPQSDFDVLAYHLNGPKEWFQAGRIEFLPHNVYTSFPFLTEMLLLSGM